MTEANQFTIDTGRGYQVTGRASVDHDNGPAMLDIVLSRADGQPFKDGRTEFSVTISVDDDLS